MHVFELLRQLCFIALKDSLLKLLIELGESHLKDCELPQQQKVELEPFSPRQHIHSMTQLPALSVELSIQSTSSAGLRALHAAVCSCSKALTLSFTEFLQASQQW